jgi:Ca-activated chloride channel homolog
VDYEALLCHRYYLPLFRCDFALRQISATSRADLRPTTTIRIDTDLIMIDVTATDKNGDYVRDLQADEFQVFEDGQRRRIDFFSINDESTLSRPLAVVFALDLSGSLKPEETRTLHDAAMKFTELMRGDSVFAAISFNDKVKVEQDFTSDASKIEKAFARMNRFGGSTRLMMQSTRLLRCSTGARHGFVRNAQCVTLSL